MAGKITNDERKVLLSRLDDALFAFQKMTKLISDVKNKQKEIDECENEARQGNISCGSYIFLLPQRQ